MVIVDAGSYCFLVVSGDIFFVICYVCCCR